MASRSVAGFFRNQCNARRVGAHHDVQLPHGGWGGWNVIVTSRNPFSWYVSKFKSLPSRWKRKHPLAVKSFENFVDEGLRRTSEGAKLEGPYYSQSFWMDRHHDIPKSRITVLRFENIVAELQRLPFVKSEVHLGVVGKTRGDYRGLYNSTIQGKVAKLCESDFEAFSYDPERL